MPNDISCVDKNALLAYLQSYITPHKMKRMQEVLAHRTRYLTVVMENTAQAHNANAVLRTAEIFGLQDVHVIERHTFSAFDTIAMGAHKWLDVHRYKNTTNALAALKKAGYRLVATIPSPQAHTPATLPLDHGKIALLFGTEETGLSAESCAQADEFLYIPMFGFTQSFNVSVSVALCVQQLMSRLRQSSIMWQLTEQQKQDLLLDWVKSTVRAAPHLEKLFLSHNVK
jgi:tRNA (guanosine-2'-O-)-methyltransferase